MTKSIDEILAGLPARQDTCGQTTDIDTAPLPYSTGNRSNTHVGRGTSETTAPTEEIAFQPIQNRYEALDLLNEIRRHLHPQIPDSAMAILKAHLSVLPEGPITPDMLLISYASTDTVEKRSKVRCARTRHRCEIRLAEAGVIELKRSGNGKRFPTKRVRGRVVDAYGINLRPLFLRLQEFRELKRQIDLEAEAKRNFAEDITQTLRDLQEIACEKFGDLPDRVLKLVSHVRKALRRVTLTSSDMQELRDAVELEYRSLYQGKPTEVSAPDPDELAAANKHDNCRSPELRPADKTSASGRQNIRHIESTNTNTDKPARGPGTQRSIADVWYACTSIASLYPDPPASPKALADVILEFSGYLGLRQNQALAALKAWGPTKMLLALDYVAGRLNQIAKPDGYILSMLRKWQSGEAVASGLIHPGSC